jgi:hypothetical protein
MAIYHPRNEWVVPSQPVTGPSFDAKKIKYIVVHYGAVPWSEDRLRNAAQYWRDTQAFYLSKTPPYSIGYQIGVDRVGELWELRGFDFKNAANNSTWKGSPYYEEWPLDARGIPRPNDVTVSIHVILPMNGELAPGQQEGIANAVALIRKVIGRDVPVIPHSDVVQTTCPGAPLRQLIRSGAFDPQKPEPPAPEPPTPEPTEDETVFELWRDPRYAFFWRIQGGDIMPAVIEDYRLAQKEKWRITVSQHDQRLKAALHRNGLTLKDLPKS